MKGMFDLVPTIFGVLVFMIGVTVIVISFITSITVVTEGEVKIGYSKLNVIDLAHNFESCLSENGQLKSEEIKQKLDSCREKTGADYAELVDINSEKTDNKYISGSQKSGDIYHPIFLNLLDRKETHQAKLFVYQPKLV